ncbi:MAG: HEAT repeat domain-containing protein [Planctomycetota bacterium]|nr:HEAT repeat domain-containing protein [Planctomycetota bacterium]
MCCDRFAVVLIAGVLLLGSELGSVRAWAHGGVIVPPPPRSKGPRGPGGGGPPSHVDPGFGGPIVTPGAGPTTKGSGRASKRKTPITPTVETSWQLWWNLEREAWLPARRFARVAVTPAGDGRTAAGWEAERRAIARTRLLPFLLSLLAPDAKHPDDVVASAAIALGKIARDKEAIEALFALVLDPRRSGMVRESAALALGHLRRDDDALRAKTLAIEGVRGRLLQVFDGNAGGKRLDVPLRTRCFAMYALGMLGDQPWRDDPLSRDGRLITKLLWERLAVPYRDRELHIALLTALGLQPAAGIPDGVQEGLRAIVGRKKALGHQWDLLKRAHAVTAVARLGGTSGHALLLRLMADTRRSIVVRLAALLAIAERSPHLAAAERGAALRLVQRAFGLEQQMLAVGLANVALGRMVGADLAAGSDRALAYDKADELLIERVAKAPWYLRGWAGLGLALAAREGDPKSEIARRFRTRARDALQRMVRDAGSQPSVQGAGAVALGLLGDPTAAPTLIAMARSAAREPEVRGHAALALAQIGGGGGSIEVLADLVVGEKTPAVVRGQAALALSLLGETRVAAKLLAALEGDDSTRRLAAVASALGRLGHLGAAEALIAKARDPQARALVRAMALVALGRLLDPQPRPHLLRLTRGTCYPARSRALQEAFTIL